MTGGLSSDVSPAAGAASASVSRRGEELDPSGSQGDGSASSAGDRGPLPMPPTRNVSSTSSPVAGGGAASVARSTTSDGRASLRCSAAGMGVCSMLRPARFLRPVANKTSKLTSTRRTTIAPVNVTQLSRSAPRMRDMGATPATLADSEIPENIGPSLTAYRHRGAPVLAPYGDLTIPDRRVIGKGCAHEATGSRHYKGETCLACRRTRASRGRQVRSYPIDLAQCAVELVLLDPAVVVLVLVGLLRSTPCLSPDDREHDAGGPGDANGSPVMDIAMVSSEMSSEMPSARSPAG